MDKHLIVSYDVMEMGNEFLVTLTDVNNWHQVLIAKSHDEVKSIVESRTHLEYTRRPIDGDFDDMGNRTIEAQYHYQSKANRNAKESF